MCEGWLNDDNNDNQGYKVEKSWDLICDKCLGHSHLEYQFPNKFAVQLVDGVPIIIGEDIVYNPKYSIVVF